MSRVTCHVSCVLCHMSPITNHFSQNTKNGVANQWRVCYQRGLPRLFFFSFTSFIAQILQSCFQLLPHFWHQVHLADIDSWLIMSAAINAVH